MLPREKAADLRQAMRQSLLWSLRFRTLLLVLLAVIPALLLTVYSASEHRSVAQIQLRESAQRLARLAAMDAEGRVENARGVLGVIAMLPEVRALDAEACNTTFARIMAQHPDYASIGAALPNGRIFANSLPFTPTVNIADRTYFRRAVETREFAVGTYQIGRITRESTINFGQPVLDPSGKVTAVVFVALRLDWLQRFAQWRLPERATLSLFDDKGQILLHHPDPDQWIGKDIRQIAPLNLSGEVLEGTAESSLLDGIPRLLVYAPLPVYRSDSRALVGISVPLDVVYHETDNIFRRNILGLALVAVLALVAAWVGGDLFFLRQVSTLVNTARRLSRGDLSARTGIRYGRDELSQLTVTFDEMAESMEHLTRRYELLLSSAGEGIYGVSPEGITTFINPAGARMLGYTQEELVGTQHHDTIHHSHPDGSAYPRADCPVVAAFQSGESRRGDNEVFWRKDGTSFPVDYVATPAREQGKIVGAVVVFKDITERKKAEQELQEAHAAVVEAALEKKRFHREVIRSVTRDKLHLVDSIELPDDSVRVYDGPLNTPQDDREVRHHLRTVATEAGMSREVATQLIHAAGEATTNAVKHATSGRAEVFRSPDRLIVRVTDRGSGIPTESLPASLLQAGFSTKVSMGVGYTMMLELADRVWLITGPNGTVVQLEKWIDPDQRPVSPLTAAIERVHQPVFSST